MPQDVLLLREVVLIRFRYFTYGLSMSCFRFKLACLLLNQIKLFICMVRNNYGHKINAQDWPNILPLKEACKFK